VFLSAGGTASGKTTLCKELREHLGDRVVLLEMDRFYKGIDHSAHDNPATAHNFDVPDALDWPLFVDTLQKLSTGQSVQVPRYSFETHQRLKEHDTLKSAEVILVEGVFALHDPRVTRQTLAHAYLRESCELGTPLTFLCNVTG
jgi:uridine kinase